MTRKQKYEARRKKRREVELCYRDHVPPQVRHMRQSRWMERVNPNPQVIVMPYHSPEYYRKALGL